MLLKWQLFLSKKPVKQEKSNYVWYIAGSFLNALSSIVLVVAVKRVSGEYVGNDFSIAYTVSQILITIGYFEVRPFQVTDVSYEYKPGTYIASRFITCFLMFLSTVSYIESRNATGERKWFIFLLCFYKLTEAFIDVFEGEFQRNLRVDLSGKSITVRTFFSVLFFLIILIVSKSAIYACIGACVVHIFCALLYDIPIMSTFSSVAPDFDIQKLFSLFKDTVLLAVGAYMYTYIFNSAKTAVDLEMPELNYAFGAIFMPTSFIYLLCSVVFKPLLTGIAASYNKKEYKRFFGVFLKLSFGIAGITLLSMLAAFIAGIPVLSFIYDRDLSMFKRELVVLLLGGGFNSLALVYYYGATVMRKQGLIFAIYLVTFVVAFFLPGYLAMNKGIMGATLSYLIITILQAVLFGGIIICKRLHLKRLSVL